MQNDQRVYIAIDLKSFYASVECMERGLDPLDACLVVADEQRTEKTICLAVSPALKRCGIGGRDRLFEVISKVRDANRKRGRSGTSTSGRELAEHPELAIDFIVAKPRMALYVDYSTRVYETYLRFISEEDMHVYSIDEVFIDATSYLPLYKVTAHELAMRMIRAVLAETGVTATAGIGTNMYLCKVAMDIVAKKMPPDKDGVRIAELDESSYRQKLWDHKPLTDFWRVGRGIARKLADYDILTMGDIAKVSTRNENFFYYLFGVNAELLIDHAWGREPTTMEYVKAYRPATHSLSSGQVLHEPYSTVNARNVMLEMADALVLKLVDGKLLTDQIVVHISYDRENLTRPEIASRYTGKISVDHYGRPVPVHSHGTLRIKTPTSSSRLLVEKFAELFDRIVNPLLLIRRLNLSVHNLVDERKVPRHPYIVEMDLFADLDKEIERNVQTAMDLKRERKRQEAVLKIKKMFGKNAILRGINYSDGATQRERNGQIGGHKE